MAIRRRATKRERDAAKLEAAILGVPVWDGDEFHQLVDYARLLKPRPLNNEEHKAAERARLLSAALVASAAALDLDATAADGSEPVHTQQITLEDGGTARVADVEPVTEDGAARVAARAADPRIRAQGTPRQ